MEHKYTMIPCVKRKNAALKEDCIVLGEAVRVAGFKSPWGQAAA